jgi:membrane fusion protein, multidrug efflux system
MRWPHLPRWIFLLLILMLASSGIWVFQSMRAQARQTKTPPRDPPAVPVTIAAAFRGNMPVYFDGLGSVTAYNTVTVKTRVSGQLMNVYFREGQFVHADDLLAEIDPRPFEVQLEQAQGQMARDQAALENGQVDVQRYRSLLSQNAIPEQQLTTQESTVRQLKATLETDQAAIDNAKLQLTYCRITSPLAGRIGLRLVDPGNIVNTGDPNGLLVITQMQPIAALFTLPEDSLAPVLQKMKTGTYLKAYAYNRDKSKKLASGELLTIDNAIDPNTGTVRLKAVFPNKEGALFPNQFINIRLLLETKTNQVVIPSVAIQRGPQGTYVYVINRDKKAELRIVQPGISEGSNTSINEGLKAGEIIVTDGTDKLKPGGNVSVRKTEAPK